MNIVFWALVIMGLIWVWAMLSFCFKGLGGWLTKLHDDVKHDINEENEEENL